MLSLNPKSISLSQATPHVTNEYPRFGLDSRLSTEQLKKSI